MRAAIFLAAGASRRFGRANKLLAPCRGRPLLHHALQAALRAPVGRILVVTGSDSGRVSAAVRSLSGRRVTIVHAPAHRAGRRASLAAGLAALRRREREAFVFLGDMPGVPPGTCTRLLRAGRYAKAARQFHGGRPGHPVLLRDTAGARERLARGEPPYDGAALARIRAGRGAASDIDRPGDLRVTP